MELEEKTFIKLIEYLDKRFNAIERQLGLHSDLMNSLSLDIEKVLNLQNKEQNESLIKELAVKKSIINQIKPGLAQKINEVKPAVKLNLLDNNKNQSNKENIIVRLAEKVKPKLRQTSRKKTSVKKERTRNPRLELFKTSEEASINTVFSSNGCSGETKEFIIEPIEVVFQESPCDKEIETYSTKHISKNGANTYIIGYTNFESIPENCLYLIGQFTGGMLPVFSFSCKKIFNKYITYASSRINNNIFLLKNKQVVL